MELTVTMTWSLEEITLALNAIENSKKKADSILPLPTVTSKIVSAKIEEPKIKSKRWWKGKKPIEIHIGSKESWFALYKIYDSIDSAAKSLGLKWASNINLLVDTDRVYKWVYKFFKHK